MNYHDEVMITVALSLLIIAAAVVYLTKYFVINYLSPPNAAIDEEETSVPLLQIFNSQYLTDSPRKETFNFSDIKWSNILTLFLNGEKVELVNPDPKSLLSYFIRDEKGLKGTKLGKFSTLEFL